MEQPEKKSRIQDQPWYYGLVTKEMIERLLMTRGEFLVRLVAKDDNAWLVIHVKNEGEAIDSFRISWLPDEKKFVLSAAKKGCEKPPEFDTALQLINYYKEHRLPNKLRLIHGVKRPSWLIRKRDVEYAKRDIMGSGNFSDVFKGQVKMLNKDKEEKVACAIKVLKTKDISVALEKFMAEARLQTAYDHENVVQIRGVMVDCLPMMMVMELCHGGSLDKHLQKRGQEVSQFEKIVYLLEAAQGMRYLHSQGCIHRDLAARNCLIGDNGKVKISDFGLSLFSPDGETVNEKLSTVPLRWMAPECLRRNQSFSFKTDVWAYGVLIFEVFSNGSKPFAEYETDSADLRMIQAIKRADMPAAPDGSPTLVVNLLQEIWQKAAAKRPDFAKIIVALCQAVKAEPFVPVLEVFVVNQLPNVTKVELPDFDWSEEKAKKAEQKKKKKETAREDARKAKQKQMRDAYRAKRAASNSSQSSAQNTGSHEREARSNESQDSQEMKKTTESNRPKNSDGGGGESKWLTATITKLKEGLKGTKKDVVVAEKKYEVAEARKKETGKKKTHN